MNDLVGPMPVYGVSPLLRNPEIRKAIRMNAMMKSMEEILAKYVVGSDPAKVVVVDSVTPPLRGSDSADAMRYAIRFTPVPAAPPEPEPIKGPMPCQRIIDLSGFTTT